MFLWSHKITYILNLHVPISDINMPTHDLGMSRSNSSHSQQRLNDSDIPEIRVKTAYNGQIFITYIDHKITYPMLMTEMKEICGFGQDQDCTVKWVDEEGDPCIIQSQVPF